MTTPEDTVGFGKNQIDPWCKHRWELIKLIDSDKEILREVFTLSESKISLPESMKVKIVYCLGTFALSFNIEMNWRMHIYQLKQRSLLGFFLELITLIALLTLNKLLTI